MTEEIFFWYRVVFISGGDIYRDFTDESTYKKELKEIRKAMVSKSTFLDVGEDNTKEYNTCHILYLETGEDITE